VIRQLLLSVLLPALAAALVVVIARKTRRAEARDRGAWGVALAPAVAFVISFGFEAGWPGWPLPERWQWIAVLAAAAGLVGAGSTLAGPRGLLNVAVALAVGAIAGWAIRLPGLDGVGPRAALAAVVLGAVLLLDPIAARRPGPALPIGLAVVLAALSFVLLRSHNAKLAMTAGALSASAGTIGALTLIRLAPAGSRAGTTVFAALLPTLAMTGFAYDYGDLPPWCFALPAVAPLLLWIAEAPALARRPAPATLLRVVLLLGPCLVAVLLALRVGAGESDGGGGGDYGGYP
jgi:hypothetical protein